MIYNAHTRTEKSSRRPEAGSVSVLAILMLAVLAFVGANVLLNVTRRYNGQEKAQGWQEALFAAEAGADYGLANVRWTVVPGTPAAFSGTNGWVTTTSTNNTTYTCTLPTMTQVGESTVQTWAVVTVDSPTAANPAGLKDAKGNQWYRIRSSGHAKLSGLARASIDTLVDANARHTNSLRKFSLRWDRTSGAALTTPEAVRTIEVLAQPKTGMIPALLADSKLHFHDNNTVDSFDSSDPTKSSTIGGLAGQYDATKKQLNGDVMSNGSADDALKIDGTHTKIYGDAGTNGGTFANTDGEIQSPGQVNNSVSSNVDPVPVPKWGLAGQPAINPAITTVTKDTTLTVTSNTANNYYKIDKIDGKKLDLQLPAGVTTATVNIWITDKMTGELHIPVGMTVNVYFSGHSFKPKDDGHKNGFDNDNQTAQTLTIYGCDPVKGNLKMDLNLHDTSFYGSVYAPSADLKLKSDLKKDVAYYGSFIADTIDANGDFHYDEALNGLGEVIDYARASYTEDER